MKRRKSKYRFLIAAGGTGGHLYPAIAVADSIRQLKSESQILFVGTNTHLEATVVPKEGFDFKSIWISGFDRSNKTKNLLFPLKLLVSGIQAFWIAFRFLPKVAIGAGAYVSGPVLWAANLMGSKIVLLEQNSYPGITNRLLEKKADEIHISFEETRKYFRFQEKLFLTGNPIRTKITLQNKNDAKKNLGLDENKKTILILGGSLGALSINNAVRNSLEVFSNHGFQLIWQVGKKYFNEFKEFETPEVKVFDFIEKMELAYSAADLVIARAGATTIAEISCLGLPALFIPSPNVAADHQYKNAEALYRLNACELIKDSELKDNLTSKILELLNSEEKLKMFSDNIKKNCKREASEIIARRCIKLAEVF